MRTQLYSGNPSCWQQHEAVVILKFNILHIYYKNKLELLGTLL